MEIINNGPSGLKYVPCFAFFISIRCVIYYFVANKYIYWTIGNESIINSMYVPQYVPTYYK